MTDTPLEPSDAERAALPNITLNYIEWLESRSDRAQALVAAAYEAAARVCTGDEDRPERIPGARLRRMSVNEQFAYDVLQMAWKDADEIRALTPADAVEAQRKRDAQTYRMALEAAANKTRDALWTFQAERQILALPNPFEETE